MSIVKARWVLPIGGPPIENGAVELEGPLIRFVGPASEAPRRATVDYGDAVIMPGLVNAHTHLELSDLVGKTPPGPPLHEWLLNVVTAMADPERSDEAVAAAARHGACASLAAGVTTVGDITRHPGITRPVLSNGGLRAVSFGEITAMGPRRNLLRARLEEARCPLERNPGGRIRIGLSPHAPYSVEPAGLATCAAEAACASLPLAIHLAESREEAEFAVKRCGPLVDLLRRIGAWDESIPVSGCGPIEVAERAGLLTRRTVIAHANYADERDIGRIARGGSSVAYCPRTHAAFAHPPHPFDRMLSAGVNVCVATDSLASAPSLSPMDEIAFLLDRHADCDPFTLLEMITIRAARALGLGREIGTLVPAKRADIVVFPLSGRVTWDPGEFIRSSPKALAVWVDGELIPHS